MKWLSIIIMLGACSGPPFASETFSVPAKTLEQDSGLDSGAGGVSGSVGTASDAGRTGDAGEVESGASGDGGAGGTSESNGLAGAPSALPLCVVLPVWSVNCDFGEPTEYLSYGGFLYRAPDMPSDCNGNCPPIGIREDYCNATLYVYDLIGPC